MKKSLLSALVACAVLAVASIIPSEAQAFGFGRRQQQNNALNAAAVAAARGGNFQASFGPGGNLRQVRSSGNGFVPVNGAGFNSFQSFHSFGSSCGGGRILFVP